MGFEIGRREAYPVLYLCISRTLYPRLLTLELLSTQISVFVLPADVRCPPSRKQLDAADAECPQAGIHTKTRRPQTLQSSVCLTSFPRFSSCGFSKPCEAAQESNDASGAPSGFFRSAPSPNACFHRFDPALVPSAGAERTEGRGCPFPGSLAADAGERFPLATRDGPMRGARFTLGLAIFSEIDSEH